MESRRASEALKINSRFMITYQIPAKTINFDWLLYGGWLDFTHNKEAKAEVEEVKRHVCWLPKQESNSYEWLLFML